MTKTPSAGKASKTRAASARPHAALVGWLGDWHWKKGADLDRRSALVLVSLVGLVWLIAAAYLVLVSQTMVLGRRIQGLRDQVAAFQRENNILQQQIAEQQSASDLLRDATGLGFGAAVEMVLVEP